MTQSDFIHPQSSAISNGAKALVHQKLIADLAELRDRANLFSIAINDLRFELSQLLPGLNDEALDVVAGRLVALALGDPKVNACNGQESPPLCRP